MTTAASAGALQIRVNGQPAAVAEATTVAAYLRELGKDARTVAVERNGDIVRRALFEKTQLEHGDVLEIVQFVQGG